MICVIGDAEFTMVSHSGGLPKRNSPNGSRPGARRRGTGFSRLAAVVLLLLPGCAGGGDRFAGTVTTDQGACGPGFDAAGKATASLVLRDGKVQFAPNDGVLVLAGQADEAGHVTASSNTMGADRKPFPQVFDGDRKGNRITGKFATPRCRASVVLTRQ